MPTKYFHTPKSCAGTTRFPSGEVSHREYVAQVFDDKLAEEVSKSPEFAEITEQAYNEILFKGKRFNPKFHLKKKEEPKPEEPKKEVEEAPKVEEPPKPSFPKSKANKKK